jgi:predicted nucleic acid-binding protein
MTFGIAPVPVIVDASAAVAVVAEADVAATTAWSGWRTSARLLLTPPIFWPETANALLRGHRLPADAVDASLDLLSQSGVETVDRGRDGVRSAIPLAERYRLSIYDATYLSLAIDVDGTLATRDRELADAARAEGVELALD